MSLDLEWTHDCQGKQDYDADYVRLSCRMYPRGGGFSERRNGKWIENADRPEVKPMAYCHVYCGADSVVETTVYGETEDEVKAKVEQWSAEQLAVVDKAVRVALTRGSAHPAEGLGLCLDTMLYAAFCNDQTKHLSADELRARLCTVFGNDLVEEAAAFAAVQAKVDRATVT